MKSYLVLCLAAVLLSSIQACSAKKVTTVAESDGKSSAVLAAAWPKNLDAWLMGHPRIANALKWESPSAESDPNAPPRESSKVSWPNWSQGQKNDLNDACIEAFAWLAQGGPQLPMDLQNLTDEPVNMHPDRNSDSVTAKQWVSSSYMWKLYISHAAFSLALELTNQLPWSISDYDDEALRYLFDSTTMGWNAGMHFSLGTSEGQVPGKRADNLPRTSFAPPMWTYPFLVREHLIGPTRIDTISRVLDWMRYNISHFHGNNSFGTYNAVWQYRGYPPLSKMVNGTIDANYPQLGRKRWTAGCHGSVGFLAAVLRVVNIPVQPVWICEHELPYFIAEKLYMDHADNPYNDNVKYSNAPILSLMIDETTYRDWFSSDLSINITDNASQVCRNVGRSIMDFIQ